MFIVIKTKVVLKHNVALKLNKIMVFNLNKLVSTHCKQLTHLDPPTIEPLVNSEVFLSNMIAVCLYAEKYNKPHHDKTCLVYIKYKQPGCKQQICR